MEIGEQVFVYEINNTDGELVLSVLILLRTESVLHKFMVIIIIVIYVYLCHLAWADQRSHTHFNLMKQDPALPDNRALNRCEELFNWV